MNWSLGRGWGERKLLGKRWQEGRKLLWMGRGRGETHCPSPSLWHGDATAVHLVLAPYRTHIIGWVRYGSGTKWLPCSTLKQHSQTAIKESPDSPPAPSSPLTQRQLGQERADWHQRHACHAYSADFQSTRVVLPNSHKATQQDGTAVSSATRRVRLFPNRGSCGAGLVA